MNNSLTPYIPQDGFLDLVAVRMDSKQFPRLVALQPKEAVAGLARIVGAALTYTGRTIPEDDITALASSLWSELMQDYDGIGTANISLAEVNYCVRRAVLGLGPEMYGINVSSLYKVICDYCLNEGHAAQQSAYFRKKKERQAALKASAAGALMTAAEGALLNNSKTAGK